MGETNYGKCECLSVKWGFRKIIGKKKNYRKKEKLSEKRKKYSEGEGEILWYAHTETQ
ncbi:hypothetical protein [Methanosarcina acetivorans]|uniref:hypothetical protein n=1 Tax=Methanosarcina acetivorans TaxID=2214 RepID=UPI000AA770CB|nr:hypothetical protein [Methanosarcina acetivorans]